MSRERRRRAKHAPKGIYLRAAEKEATVPGVNVPYEEPENPEVVVDTEVMRIKTCAEKIVEFIVKQYER